MKFTKNAKVPLRKGIGGKAWVLENAVNELIMQQEIQRERMQERTHEEIYWGSEPKDVAHTTQQEPMGEHRGLRGRETVTRVRRIEYEF